MLTGQFAEARAEGRAEGQRALLARQLKRRFGPLSLAVHERLATWPADRLIDLGKALLEARSLQELGLPDWRPCP